MTSDVVLYVDDEPSNAALFEIAIRGQPFEGLTAPGARQALEIIEKREVSVLLTDQRMPSMTGVQLLEQVAARSPDTMRLLITAHQVFDDAVDAINRGHVHRFLRKPWDRQELLETLLAARSHYLLLKRTRELERRLLETERVYAVGVASSGIAHELRTPLTSIAMNAEMARTYLSNRPTQESIRRACAILDDVTKSVKTIAELTRSIELSTRQSDDGEVDVREVVELSALAVSGMMRRTGLLTLDIAEVPAVRGARTGLGQVVMTLLVTAIETFDPERIFTNKLHVTLKRESERVVLEILANSGELSEELRTRLFDPLRGASVSGGGAGLGLAISQRIVKEQGGTVDVESQPGVGTLFRVALPTARH